MIYKVYAQCVKKHEPIKELSKDDVKELISEHASTLLDSMSFDEIDFDDEETFNSIYDSLTSLLEEYFNKNGYLGCGDFNIVSSDIYPTRPNMAGDTSFDEKEIIDYMNRD